MMMDHTMPMDHNMHHTMPTEMPIPHSMPTEPSQIGDHISKPPTHAATLSGTKYENLIAAVKTNDPYIQIIPC